MRILLISILAFTIFYSGWMVYGITELKRLPNNGEGEQYLEMMENENRRIEKEFLAYGDRIERAAGSSKKTEIKHALHQLKRLREVYDSSTIMLTKVYESSNNPERAQKYFYDYAAYIRSREKLFNYRYKNQTISLNETLFPDDILYPETFFSYPENSIKISTRIMQNHLVRAVDLFVRDIATSTG